MDNHTQQTVQDPLTERESEILRLVRDGLSNQDIATRLFITVGTVKWYLKQIYGKLHVGSRTQAIAATRASGLLEGKTVASEQTSVNHNLPQQPTPFIGRYDELSAIANLLEDPACRLLTLVGPGGIGKTRLALQSAEQQITSYSQGVFFASLAPLSAPESIVSALAEALQFSFYPGGEPTKQLLNFLRSKHMLLVLDNFEHLLAGATFVAEMLEAGPRIKILVTSRERLNLQAETLLVVEGMPDPPQETAEDIAENSAVQLFVQSARQVQPKFPITASNLDSIANICRQVQGMPLGILLAAAWVGVLSVQEISQEIQKSLDFLETDRRDLPERQRSLRAAFDYSWRLLAEEEREVFKKLSVFRGSFTREAAQQVAGASLKSLMSLLNKSLLHRDESSGRYKIHELMRQYGEEQLSASPKENEQIHNLHCEFFANYMHQQWAAMMSPRQGTVVDEISQEFNNVLEAWNYAIRQRRIDILNNMALSLWYFCHLRTPVPDTADLFSRAAETLQTLPAVTETEIVLGHMLAHQGWLTNEASEGKALAEKSLLILRKHDCPVEMVIALETFSLRAGWGLSHFVEGEMAAREGIRIARENHIQWEIGHCLLILGSCVWAKGDFIQARQIGEECFRESESIGDIWNMAANAVAVLGPVAIELQDYGEAEKQFQQALRWSIEVGSRWGLAFTSIQLGKVALLTQDYGKAVTWLARSLDYFKKTGQEGREYYEALYHVCSLFSMQGRQEDAVELLSFLQRQNQYPKMVDGRGFRDVATASLTELRASLPDDIFIAALERGKALDLDTVVAEFLAS